MDRQAEKESIAELWATTIPGPPAKTRQRFGGVGLRHEAPPASPFPFTAAAQQAG
jgi:hypothetical protein